MIEFNNVSFSYKNQITIKSLNVRVEKGDFLAVVGSNGAGKSTFLKLCNGLLTPTQGDVTVLQKNTKVEKTSSLARNISFLFQNPDRQICCNSVKEEIAFSMKKLGFDAEVIAQRVAKTIEDFNFDADADPFTLSRGQRQRLCLACLIAEESEIMILDEPTTGLDYKECMELMNRIKKLNDNGTTIIMVCHDMEVVLDFAKQMMVMNNGEMIAKGPTLEILKQNEILKKGRLLQPQIAQTSTILGTPFDNIFTINQMVQKVQELAGTK